MHCHRNFMNVLRQKAMGVATLNPSYELQDYILQSFEVIQILRSFLKYSVKAI